MNGANVLTRFTADTKDFDSKTKKVDASISSIAKGVLYATGITKAFSAAWGMVTNSIDSAIDRYDTLQNFPKVMSNLGISAEESQKSIDKLSDKLVGLPTTLQDGASAVQRLTSKNGDIKKSTDLFLAMNNAILAGGASAQQQATAMYQLSDAYAKGKPDMMDWRSIMTAMPAQLKQVATAMGYVDADSLGEALRSGAVSMDSFMETIDKLNKEGLPGFQSFEEQARNSTGGIRTAITNMKSRVAAGVAEMIEAINKGLKEANIGDIAKVFSDIGNTIRDTLKKLAPTITKIVIKLAEIGNWINKNKTLIEAIIIPIITFVSTLATLQKVMNAVAVVQGILNAVMMMNPIFLIIGAVVALIAIFVLLWNKCEWFRNFWIGLWETIKTRVQTAITIIKVVIEAFKIAFQLVAEAIKTKINNIIDKFNTFKDKAKNVVNSVITFFKELPKKMASVGLDIAKGIGNGITNGISWIKNKIKEFVGNVTKFIKKVFKIGSPSKLMANEVGQWIPKGIGVGIEANTKDVTQAMNDIQKQIMTTFQVSPQLANSSSLHYSPNVNVINNVDITQDPLGQMVNNIKTFAGGAKNDYNYGAGF